MKYYEINGQKKLVGKTNVENSKNAILPIMAATVLINEQIIIKNVPKFTDVLSAIDILSHLGKEVLFQNGNLVISGQINNCVVPQNLSCKLRASLFFLGPILSVAKKAEIFEPGGCNLGDRPINYHINSLKTLGAEVLIDNEKIIFTGTNMKNNIVNLPFASVGTTINTILACVFLKGESLIINSAKEPEIVDLCNFLKKCGAKIYGEGTSVIKIIGVKHLSGCEYTPIPDRIVGGSYLLMAAATHGKVELCNFKAAHNMPLLKKLLNCGCSYSKKCDTIYLKAPTKFNSVGNIIADVYPSFPTDLQPIMLSFALNINHNTIVQDKVFNNRFNYVQELKKMNAHITLTDYGAVVQKSKLIGTKVFATDLRAGGSLILAGLCARGKTQIYNTHFIDRGYENIVNKLKFLGADIFEKEE